MKLSLWSNGSQIIQWELTQINVKASFFVEVETTMEPVINDHLYNAIDCLLFI